MTPPALVWLALVVPALGLVPLACVRETERAWLCAALLASASGVFWFAAQRRWALRVPVGLLPLLLFLVVVALQLLPVHGLVSERGTAVLGGIEPRALSLVPARTSARLVEALALVATFVAAALLFARVTAARRLCAALLGLGAALSIYGILARSGSVPLVDDCQTTTVAVATFVNRNHFAGFLELALLAGVGLLGHGVASRWSWTLRVWLVGGLVACGAGLLATESRAGLLMACSGGLLLVLLRRRVNARHVCIVLACSAAVLLCAPDSLVTRFLRVGDELRADGSRPDIWLAGLRLALAFPWLGTGLGCYGDLSPATQILAVPGRVEHAHCDPLEVLVETGLCGALLVGSASVLFTAAVGRKILHGEQRERTLLASGLFAGVVALLGHGLVDFNLQIPANAAWFAIAAGAAAGLSGAWTGRMVLPRTARCAAVACGIAGMLAVERAVTNAADDGERDRSAAAACVRDDPTTAERHAVTALAKNPFSPTAWHLLGSARLGTGAGDAELALDRAIGWTNPHDRAALQVGLATELLVAGRTQSARRMLESVLLASPRDRRAAWSRLYALAPAHEVLRALSPRTPDVRRELARFLLAQGEFQGRELELAELRGRGASPVLLTLSDSMALVGCTTKTAREGQVSVLSVELAFTVRAAAAPVPLVLRLDGNGAGLYRSFSADSSAYRWEFRMDPSFPPGRYALSLDFAPDAPRLPLGGITLAESVLDLLARERLVAGADLYLSTREGSRRGSTQDGVRLADGDVLWRRVAVPSAGCELRIEGADLDALRVSFEGEEVQPSAPGARYLLRPAEAGLLEIRSSPAMAREALRDGIPFVRGLTSIRRGER